MIYSKKDLLPIEAKNVKLNLELRRDSSSIGP